MFKKLRDWFDKIPARDLSMFALGFSVATFIVSVIVSVAKIIAITG